MCPKLNRILFITVIIVSYGPAHAQTVNDGFAAMAQGDFLGAFSALRRLEQAGDAQAAQMLKDVFLAQDEQPVAAGVQMVPERRHLAAASRSAPARSPRPQTRAVPVDELPIRAPAGDGTTRDLPPPLTNASFRAVDGQLAEIGRLLFFDPILSGNKDISCAVCHHPSMASGDGVSLGLGTGARGLGDKRVPVGTLAASRRIPRNAPALWNLGAHDIRVLFHDGRVEGDPDKPGYHLTPQGPLDYLPFDSILAVQAMFPVLSHEEMAGRPGENPVADAVHDLHVQGDEGAWAILAGRVDAIAAYRAAFTGWRGREASVQMVEIANAIAAFIEAEFRADRSPFDHYLREAAALSSEAGEGMRLFYGRANCASCHSGALLSDQKFHAMGQPPIGPGKDRDEDNYTRDIGRAGVTLDKADAFAFRTPMLRNVLHSGPWGHAGAFSDIRTFLRHHLDPVTGLARYAPQAILPVLESAEDDYAAIRNAKQIALISAAAARSMAQRPIVKVQDDELEMLVAFLEALTDESSLGGRLGVPDTVPSGLPVER